MSLYPFAVLLLLARRYSPRRWHSTAVGRRDRAARKNLSRFCAGGWSDFTVWRTKAAVLAVHSEFISRSTWGMPAGYSFGSAPSPGWKNSTKVARALAG